MVIEKDTNKVAIGLITFLAKNISKTDTNENMDNTSSKNSKNEGTTSHKNLPMSIKIHGRFQNLINIRHVNLCQYVDIHRKHDRIILVLEHYNRNLLEITTTPSQIEIDKCVYQLLDGLNFLHKNGIIHRNLNPKNILLNKKNNIYLSNFGLFYITNGGEYVSFPIGYPLYLPIESLATINQPNRYSHRNTTKCDIWMLGMCLLDWLTGFTILKSNRNNVNEILKYLNNMVDNSTKYTPYEYILKSLNMDNLDSLNIPEKILDIIKSCLKLNISERPSAAQIIERFYGNRIDKKEIVGIPSFWNELNINFDIDSSVCYHINKNHKYNHPLDSRPLEEIFYLWKISGGNLYNEFVNQNVLKTYPPILTLPQIIFLNGETHSPSYLPNDMFDDHVTVIPLDNLYQLLNDIEPEIYHPIMLLDDEIPTSCVDTINLPKCIKERITIYQLYRMVLFRKLLLEGYPHTRSKIISHSKFDIPLVYRNLTWAALLDVPIDYKEKYASLDKTTPNPIDRQIDVDIPRCHQYSEIMSSPEAHIKLKRVLKAWVSNQTYLVYWQGLDSLLAPFLSLNMGNEALAHACLEKFVNKFCFNIFIKNNSLVMQEYLLVYFLLLAYHDPKLYIHMKQINFEPELFAIPWFLTMFSHVFPLDKIYHLWDTLLLGSSVLPMCFAVAILVILRDKLISTNFNGCISIFSNVTGVDVESCMNIGMEIYNKTPPSVAIRNYDNPNSRTNDDIPSHFLQFPNKQPLDLNILKNENCPRISARDAIIILYNAILNKSPFLNEEIKVNNINPNNMVAYIIQKFSSDFMDELSVIFVDIRSIEEYRAGRLPGSINRPLSNVSSSSICCSTDINLPTFNDDKEIIICSNKVVEASQVGSLLVIEGYRYVSVLDIPMHSLAEYNVFISSD